MISQVNVLHALGWAVLNSLWQMALLWVLYQCITAILQSAKPATKGLLATFLIILGFGWFVHTFITTLQSANTDAFFSSFFLNENASISNLIQQLLPATSIFYLSLLVFPFFRLIRNYRYVQVIRREGIIKAPPEWRLFVQEMSARMGIRKPVHIWISEWVTSPVTIGYLKPVILVPLAAINKLSPLQMEAVLLHELSHIHRYDYLLNFICNIIYTFLYFNPFARAFISISEAEREKSCDEWVLQFRYNTHDYASALLTLEKISHEQRVLMLSAAGNKKGLYHRIETILGIQQKRKITVLRVVPVLATLGYILIMNMLLYSGTSLNGLAVMPQRSSASALFLASAKPVSDNKKISNIVFTTYRKKITKPGKLEKKERIENNEWVSAIIPVNYYEKEPENVRRKEDETIIKETVLSSRKVLENKLWQHIEQELADAFTNEEKAEQQLMLKNVMNRFDWKKWEDILRRSFDEVNWEKVNLRLNEATNQYKSDSLVKAYNELAVNLEILQNELKAMSLSHIPDSDISVKALAEKLQEIQREIAKLKSARPKKIVHL